MTISIITPWRNGVAALLTDYAAAIPADAQIITVDNGSDAEQAETLRAFTMGRDGVYIRNEQNAGFAAANNQGYQAATGDLIIFLNSDVTADPVWLKRVAHDVRPGALYGPSLQAQHLYGDVWPYLEGWCIAATGETWNRLIMEWNAQHSMKYGAVPCEYMVWDSVHYPDPYWEDNDLCLRALHAGLRLIQTEWPIRHKGGQTAGPLRNHADAFERNRSMFLARLAPIAQARRNAPVTPVYRTYETYCAQESDIYHHLPLLFAKAHGNVVELGTRSGVSTAALLAGVERFGGHVWSVDIDPQSARVAEGHPQWTFVQASSTDMQTRQALKKAQPIDLLLIDTIHTEAHVAAEFAVWADAVRKGGVICVHDTETFPGVRRAVEAACAARGWPVSFVRPCHGMAVIEVP